MIAEPLLIEADIVEKDDKESRTPKWVARADWSNGNALHAFWSAHPPEQRDEFLIGRAESYVANMRAEIVAQRKRQHELWEERAEVIEGNKKKIADLPDTDTGKRKRKDIEEQGKEKLLGLRAQMIMSRDEVKRCVRYARVIQPKEAVDEKDSVANR